MKLVQMPILNILLNEIWSQADIKWDIESIIEEDIIKFENEEDFEKYKTRYKERWKEELDKAVQRMKKEL